MDKMLEQRLRFLTEADKMKNIERMTLLTDGSRRENDAEHSWHLALMALTLREYAAPEVNMDRVLRMALLHDMVEVYAGDTFCYDEKGKLDKLARETAAADRIFGMLPDEQGREFRALWEEFDAQETPDALYAASCDRFQPLINNYLTGGHTWKLGHVTRDRVLERMAPIERGIPALWPVVLQMLDSAVEQGMLKESGE